MNRTKTQGLTYLKIKTKKINRVKLKEAKKKNLNKYWKKFVVHEANMMAIIVKDSGTILKSLGNRLEEQETQGRIDTVQTTAALGMIGILRRVWENWRDSQLLRFQRRLTVTTGVKTWKENHHHHHNNNNNNNVVAEKYPPKEAAKNINK